MRVALRDKLGFGMRFLHPRLGAAFCVKQDMRDALRAGGDKDRAKRAVINLKMDLQKRFMRRPQGHEIAGSAGS